MKTNLIIACAAGFLTLALSNVTFAQNRRGPAVPSAVTPVTAEETASLQFMREEEKLARDVYRAMYKEWGLQIFDNIAASEQNHFEAVGRLLAKYGVTDPAATTAEGVFANPELAALYNQLIAKGKASIADALEVGVLIEKTDIEDLENAPATAKTDIKQVYANLLAGSLNHLEAFEQSHEVCLAAN